MPVKQSDIRQSDKITLYQISQLTNKHSTQQDLDHHEFENTEMDINSFEVLGLLKYKIIDKLSREQDSEADKVYSKRLVGIKAQQVYFLDDSNPIIIQSITDISFCKFERTSSKNSTFDKWGFTLSSDKVTMCFMFKTQTEFQRWEKCIIKYTVQSNIEDQYQLQNLLGEGTSGSVYLGLKNSTKDESFKEPRGKVAIKIIQKDKITQSPSGNQSVITPEIRVHWALDKCENILSLLEIFEDQDYVFLVLEYSKTGDLFNHVKDSNSFTEEQVRFIMEQLLLALNFLHQKHIIHRDIKLDNTLITIIDNGYYEVKLADFGLSIFTPDDEAIFNVCGTPGTIAPEILREEGCSYKADIFSLGSLFFNLLTGYQLFGGDSINEILRNNSECKLTNIAVHFEQISSSAQDLLMWMLQSDPSLRPTAQEALMHEWFTKDSQVLSELLIANENLTYENSKNILNHPSQLFSYQNIDNYKPTYHESDQNKQELLQSSKSLLKQIKTLQNTQTTAKTSQYQASPINFYKAIREYRSKSSNRHQRHQNNKEQQFIQVATFVKQEFFKIQRGKFLNHISQNDQGKVKSFKMLSQINSKEKIDMSQEFDFSDQEEEGQDILVDDDTNLGTNVANSSCKFLSEMKMSRKNIVQTSRIFLH